MRRLTVPACVCCSLLLGAMTTGCVKNPATGRSQLSFYSKQEEIEMGTQAMPGIVKEFGGAYPDAEAQAYVRDVGLRLSRVAEADYSGIPWEFTLLNSDVINAFALPGGKVFITTGLARRFESESELAGVLGHEIGHVTAKHGDKRMSEAAVLQGAASIGGAASGSEALASLFTNGAGIVLLRFSRDEEREADGLGLRYMTGAGYNPAGLLRVMEVLRDASKGGERQPEFLSTHPYPEDRIVRVTNWLKSPEYQRAMQRPDPPEWRSDYRRRLLDRLTQPAPGAPRQAAPSDPQQATPRRRAR